MNSSGQKLVAEGGFRGDFCAMSQFAQIAQLRYKLDRWYGAVAEHPNMHYRDTDFLAAEYRVGKKVTTQRC